jgi:hypothetical protein
LPEIIAIVELGELSLFGAAAEAGEGAQGDVIGTDGPQRRAP